MAERRLPTQSGGDTWNPSAELKGVYVLDRKRDRAAQLSPDQKAQLTRAVEKVKQKIALVRARDR
jgi:hypothetical protein